MAHYHGYRQRVRQKFLGNRRKVFQDYEALELLLVSVCRQKDTKEITKNLITHFGSLNQAAVFPRKVMQFTLDCNVSTLMLLHSHPDGNTEPSELGETVTNGLALTANSLGLEVHNHVLVSRDGHYGFRDNGLLWHMNRTLLSSSTLLILNGDQKAYEDDLSWLKVNTIRGICNESGYEVLDDRTQSLFLLEPFAEIICPKDYSNKYLGIWSTRWAAIKGAISLFNKITEEFVDFTAIQASGNTF